MTIYSIRKIIKESIWLLTICILIEILAGQLLNSQEDIIEIPIILAALPLINGIGGNLGSILGARLTSGLHVGYLKPKYNDKILLGNVLNIIILAVIVFSILIGIMIVILPLTGVTISIPIFKFVIVIFCAGMIMTCLVVILGITSAFIAFKRGIDPDNVVTPIITTSGDMLGISIVIILVLMIIV
ncbi:MAG: magnesium transporter [Thermoplasmata archaeon]|nr:MAG: magnesium transporter [Thermoplasmata archaeon]